MKILKFLGTDLGKRTFNFYGVKIAFRQTQEELCELFVHSNHFLREEREEDFFQILEEVADVIILTNEIWTAIGQRVKTVIDSNKDLR